jgi:hypothetical protein
MPKKKWATKEQVEWLEERMAAFVQAQQTKTTGQFFTSVYDAWHGTYCYEHGLSAAEDALNHGPTGTHRSHGRM